jgi:hypothetical protein
MGVDGSIVSGEAKRLGCGVDGSIVREKSWLWGWRECRGLGADRAARLAPVPLRFSCLALFEISNRSRVVG